MTSFKERISAINNNIVNGKNAINDALHEIGITESTPNETFQQYADWIRNLSPQITIEYYKNSISEANLVKTITHKGAKIGDSLIALIENNIVSPELVYGYKYSGDYEITQDVITLEGPNIIKLIVVPMENEWKCLVMRGDDYYCTLISPDRKEFCSEDGYKIWTGGKEGDILEAYAVDTYPLYIYKSAPPLISDMVTEEQWNLAINGINPYTENLISSRSLPSDQIMTVLYAGDGSLPNYHLITYAIPKVPDTIEFTVESDGINTISLDGEETKTSITKQMYDFQQITLEATPEDGYKFSYWETEWGQLIDNPLIYGATRTPITAVFTPIASEPTPIRFYDGEAPNSIIKLPVTIKNETSHESHIFTWANMDFTMDFNPSDTIKLDLTSILAKGSYIRIHRKDTDTYELMDAYSKIITLTAENIEAIEFRQYLDLNVEFYKDSFSEENLVKTEILKNIVIDGDADYQEALNHVNLDSIFGYIYSGTYEQEPPQANFTDKTYLKLLFTPLTTGGRILVKSDGVNTIKVMTPEGETIEVVDKMYIYTTTKNDSWIYFIGIDTYNNDAELPTVSNPPTSYKIETEEQWNELMNAGDIVPIPATNSPSVTPRSLPSDTVTLVLNNGEHFYEYPDFKYPDFVDVKIEYYKDSISEENLAKTIIQERVEGGKSLIGLIENNIVSPELVYGYTYEGEYEVTNETAQKGAENIIRLILTPMTVGCKVFIQADDQVTVSFIEPQGETYNIFNSSYIWRGGEAEEIIMAEATDIYNTIRKTEPPVLGGALTEEQWNKLINGETIDAANSSVLPRSLPSDLISYIVRNGEHYYCTAYVTPPTEVHMTVVSDGINAIKINDREATTSQDIITAYEGAGITLEAIPADGYEFDYWQTHWDQITNNPFFNLANQSTVTAVFKEREKYIITLTNPSIYDATLVNLYTRESISGTGEVTFEIPAGDKIQLIFDGGEDEDGIWDSFNQWHLPGIRMAISPYSFVPTEDTNIQLNIATYVRYNCYNIDTDEFLTVNERKKVLGENSTVTANESLEINGKNYELVSYTPNPTIVESGPQWGKAYYKQIPTKEYQLTIHTQGDYGYLINHTSEEEFEYTATDTSDLGYQYTYTANEGDSITLSIPEFAGWSINYWTIDGVKHTTKTITFTMDSHKKVEVYFCSSVVARYYTDDGENIPEEIGTYTYTGGIDSIVQIDYSMYMPAGYKFDRQEPEGDYIISFKPGIISVFYTPDSNDTEENANDN